MRPLFYLMIVMLLSCTGQKDYIAFTPIFLERNELIEKPSFINDELKVRIVDVLEFYKEPYQYDKEGNILILKSLSKNKELIWNYTTKANDIEWLNNINK